MKFKAIVKGEMVNISARIEKELLKKVRKYKLNISESVRQALKAIIDDLELRK